MVENPRVAVIIPCFNDGEYLRDAIGSLQQQEACEVVIVDDGSSAPETLRILDALRGEGIAVISQPNSGLGPARMTGIAHTGAPLIHTLDADDLLAPGALTILADVLAARPDVAFAWGNYRTFGARECTFPSAPHLDPWRITYFQEIPANCMIRRSTFTRFGGWEHAPYEDWDLWLRWASRGVAGIGIPRVTLLYREHATPRLYHQTLNAHDGHWRTLNARHPHIFRARMRNRRSSDSPTALKLLLTIIDATPGLSPFRRRQLWTLARYLVQPERTSSCFRGPLSRAHGKLQRIFEAR